MLITISYKTNRDLETLSAEAVEPVEGFMYIKINNSLERYIPSADIRDLTVQR